MHRRLEGLEVTTETRCLIRAKIEQGGGPKGSPFRIAWEGRERASSIFGPLNPSEDRHPV